VTSADFAVGTGSPDGFVAIQGANDLCAQAALRGKLSGTFHAWIEDERGTLDQSHLASAGPSDDPPLVAPNNSLIAASLAELLDAGPRIPIAVTETGDTLPTAPVSPGAGTNDPFASCPPTGLVWTGARSVISALFTECSSWNVGSPNLTGGAGAIAKDPTAWSYVCGLSCSSRAHLYCFQQ
jgi:hypothetical protein